MSFFRDFLQKFFGGVGIGDQTSSRFDDHQPRNEFRNPIWQNDDDYEDDHNNDYRHFANSNQVPLQIFTNPVEIMRYFESQMDMMKNMMDFRFVLSLGQNSPNISPSNQNTNSLRNQYLKPNRALPFSNEDQSNMKIDLDLDGKLSANDLSQVWKNLGDAENKTLIPEIGSQTTRSSMFFNITPKVQMTIEQISTVTDRAGNTETIIKRQVGDKLQTVITKRNKDGTETKTEKLSDLDKNDFKVEPITGTLNSRLWEFFDFGSRF